MNIAEDPRGRPDHLLLPLAALLALPPVRPRQAATLHVEEVLREQPDQQHHRLGACVHIVKLYELWTPGGVGGEEKDDRLEDEEKAGAGEGGGDVEEGEGGGQAPAQANNKGGGGKNNQNQKGGQNQNQNQNQKGKNKGGQQKQQQQPKTSAKIIASSFMEFE